MKSKSLILMFVSLGFGLIAAIGISQVMGRSGGNTTEIRMGQVLVAVDFIETSRELNEEIVRIEEWPASIIPENAIRDIAQIQNMSTVRAIPRGAPIFATDIIDKNQQSNINLKDGQRVVFIKVGAESTGHGLLKPGDRIDVIGSFTQGFGHNSSTVASTFLKNIEVYSVNETTERKGPREATGAKQNSIVGIILNQKQAEKVALVQKSGSSLTFTIRGVESYSAQDEVEDPLPSWLDPVKTASEVNTERPKDTSEQSNLSAQLTAFMESMKASSAQRPRETMRVYHGGEVQIYYINPDGSLSETDSTKAGKDTNFNPLDIDFNAPIGKPTGKNSALEETEVDEYINEG